MPIFIASVIAFYVTLLGVQAVTNGQPGRAHYSVVGGVTAVTALVVGLAGRSSKSTTETTPVQQQVGSIARYLCETCGKPIRSKGWRCESCGATHKTWNLPAGMMSPRARHRGAAKETAAPRPETPKALAVYHGVMAIRLRRTALVKAVAFVAEQSGEPIQSGNDLLRQLRGDPNLLRRLYWTAAKRLHPDHNNGKHLPEWFQLQQAVTVLAGGSRRIA